MNTRLTFCQPGIDTEVWKKKNRKRKTNIINKKRGCECTDKQR